MHAFVLASFFCAHTLPSPLFASPTTPSPARHTLWSLFAQSFDLFTILLLAGSVLATAVAIRCVFRVRRTVILPPATELAMRRMVADAEWRELARFAAADRSILGRILAAALASPRPDRASRREAAEMAAGEQCAHWFRLIEPLHIIGNLGPLLGLAGTVWGMIIAFASLGETGGRAGPAELSAGISKALFHTLLGLVLAVPALSVFGFYRAIVDRWCTRAMVVASELLEQLPDAEPAPTKAPHAPPIHP